MFRLVKSNINHAIGAGVTIRSVWFQDVHGDVNLTGVSNGGSVAINITGTITNSTALNFRNLTTQTLIKPPIYADNAAAATAGLAIGELYSVTTTGEVLAVVA